MTSVAIGLQARLGRGATVLVLGAVLAAVPAVHAFDVDPLLPVYHPGPPLHGRLAVAGVDSLAPMMRRMIVLFRQAQPGVELTFATGAPPSSAEALAAGTAQIGYNARTMWPPEIAAITKARGRPPRLFRIAGASYNTIADKKTHTMAVFVHADNPLRQLTLAQVDAIFSATRRRGAPTVVTTWGELGLVGEWADRPVHAYTTKHAAGPTNFVQEVALRDGEWNPSVREIGEFGQDDKVIAALATDRNGIAIVGLPYGTAQVTALALADAEGGPFFEPSLENVVQRRYPLSRLLYFYVNDDGPGKPLDPRIREFLRFVLSRDGQAVALAAGFLPLPPPVVREELQKIE